MAMTKTVAMTTEELQTWRMRAIPLLRVQIKTGKALGVYGRMMYLLYAFARGVPHAWVERRMTEHSLHPDGMTIAGCMTFVASRLGLYENFKSIYFAGWVDTNEERVKRFGPRVPRPRPAPGTRRPPVEGAAPAPASAPAPAPASAADGKAA